jgi:telomerase reverse transcriptase
VHDGSARQIELRNQQSTAKILAYIFPRQFKLHNVFTSTVNGLITSQKLLDYTLREEEIIKAFGERSGDGVVVKIKVPKRLRGEAVKLVQRLQILHGRCSYTELLRYYCPSIVDASGPCTTTYALESQPPSVLDRQHAKSSNASQRNSTSTPTRNKETQDRRNLRPHLHLMSKIKTNSLVDLATPTAHVSRFCQAVLGKLIPDEFWGIGPDQVQNKAVVLKCVNHFVRLRRFENMSLHEVLQGLKVLGHIHATSSRCRSANTS